jgi:hypothetical protein
LIETANENIAPKQDSIKSFYLLIVSQASAVAEAASIKGDSALRAEALRRLAQAVDEVLSYRPPAILEERWKSELEARWREELFRGLLYLSNFSHKFGDHELAFQHASTLVERLSTLDRKHGVAARDFLRALNHLSWSAIITRRFSDALSSSGSAVKLSAELKYEDMPAVQLNLAHALAFNGRVDEARRMYQRLNTDEVAEDLEKLINAGLCIKLFGEILSKPIKCDVQK